MAFMRTVQQGGFAWYDPIIATQASGGREGRLTQGRTLSGGSSVNGMIYVRGQKEDFDGWRDMATLESFGIHARRHRRGVAHASPFRPCRVEHDAGR